jgi:hypothetical protein
MTTINAVICLHSIEPTNLHEGNRHVDCFHISRIFTTLEGGLPCSKVLPRHRQTDLLKCCRTALAAPSTRIRCLVLHSTMQSACSPPTSLQATLATPLRRSPMPFPTGAALPGLHDPRGPTPARSAIPGPAGGRKDKQAVLPLWSRTCSPVSW